MIFGVSFVVWIIRCCCCVKIPEFGSKAPKFAVFFVKLRSKHGSQAVFHWNLAYFSFFFKFSDNFCLFSVKKREKKHVFKSTYPLLWVWPCSEKWVATWPEQAFLFKFFHIFSNFFVKIRWNACKNVVWTKYFKMNCKTALRNWRFSKILTEICWKRASWLTISN